MLHSAVPETETQCSTQKICSTGLQGIYGQAGAERSLLLHLIPSLHFPSSWRKANVLVASKEDFGISASCKASNHILDSEKEQRGAEEVMRFLL